MGRKSFVAPDDKRSDDLQEEMRFSAGEGRRLVAVTSPVRAAESDLAVASFVDSLSLLSASKTNIRRARIGGTG